MRLYSKIFLLRTYKNRIFIILLLLLLICGCTYKFERSVLIEGMYYPNGTVQLEGRPFESLDQLYSFTVTQPFRVTELGLFTKPFFNMQEQRAYEYNHGGSTSFHACKAEIPGSGEYCIPTLMLKNTGRFEWHKRTLTFIEWIQDNPILSIFISIILLILVIIIAKHSLKQQQLLLIQKQKEAEEKRLQEIRIDQLRKEKEIQRRKDIVLDIINNLYKETQREVNKTLIPTLLNELSDIFKGLHSENLNDLILNGSITDFQNILNSLKSELNRLKKLAIHAQTKGYTDDDRDYAYSEENDTKMTKEKAFEIFGLKSTATKDEIKKAYRKLAVEFHPDKAGGATESIRKLAEEKFKEIKNAYDLLTN